MIQLVGPGGAGKTTAGVVLAKLLKVQFADLDAEFISRNGDISAFIDTHGYQAYARHNVECYLNRANAISCDRNKLATIFVRAKHHGLLFQRLVSSVRFACRAVCGLWQWPVAT